MMGDPMDTSGETPKDSTKQNGFYYQFFQRQYPTWLYTVAIALFALGCYIWIEFFLVVQY